MNKPIKKLIPVSKWSDFHDWPPMGGLRHLISNARKNGFDKCIVRIGRRILIDESRFFEWVDAHRNITVESK